MGACVSPGRTEDGAIQDGTAGGQVTYLFIGLAAVKHHDAAEYLPLSPIARHVRHTPRVALGNHEEGVEERTWRYIDIKDTQPLLWRFILCLHDPVFVQLLVVVEGFLTEQVGADLMAGYYDELD